jgi:hypothetical protein
VHGRAARIGFRCGGRVERAFEPRDELGDHGVGRLRLLARRHGMDLQLTQHLFPHGGIGMDVVQAPALERKIGRKLRVVVTFDAVAVDHRPVLTQLLFRGRIEQENRRCARGDDTSPGNEDPFLHD